MIQQELQQLFDHFMHLYWAVIQDNLVKFEIWNFERVQICWRCLRSSAAARLAQSKRDYYSKQKLVISNDLT